MGLIHVYSGLDACDTYRANGKLCDIITNVNWEKSIILKDGARIEKDYEVQPHDVLYIRRLPTAATTAAIIMGTIALVAGGVAAGYAIYQNRKALAELDDAQRKSKANKEAVEKLPYIRGGNNAAATGRNFPYVLGKTFFTPYKLCPAHYSIEGDRGETQYYNVVLECAYNDILLNKISMGETVIKNFEGETEPQTGVYSFDRGLYYDDKNIIEVRQRGPFITDGFNDKIICTELNAEIPHGHAVEDQIENANINKEWQTGVVQELPPHAKSVEVIVIFDGLQQYTDDGAWRPHSVTLEAQWTNDPDSPQPTWHNFNGDFEQGDRQSNTFVYNTKKQMRFRARHFFSAAESFGQKISVRLRRMTPKLEGTAKENVYLMAVQTTCYDAKKSTASNLVTAQVLEPAEAEKCCRIGLRIAANANTEGQLGAINVIETGLARVWNGTSWSETKEPTENLAAWALEILTSPHHGPSRYKDEELDLETFGAWYEYCEYMGFKAGGVITKSETKKQVLEKLCSNGNAALVYSNVTGLMEVAIDNGRNYSVALLNAENIQSISTTKELKRKADGVKVTYVNGAAGYDVDSVIFMRDGGEYDPAADTLTEEALEFVTDYAHAFKIAWRKMAEDNAQPRVVTIKAGYECAYYPLYSRVSVQHRTLKAGLSHNVIKAAKWVNGYLREIILNAPVTIPVGADCGLIVNCVTDTGRGVLPLKVQGTGKTDTLEVLTECREFAPVIPSAGNVCSFGTLDDNGEFTTVTREMKITNAEDNGNGYTLTLVDYNPALYEYGTLPPYRSNITGTPNGTDKTVEEQREYMTEADTLEKVGGVAQAAVDAIAKGHTFINKYKILPVDMCLDDIIAKMDSDAQNAFASISMSADEILLQVENLDEQQRAFIALTKDQILEQVDDMAQGLSGLIDVQAGAVSALVAGGGANGQMSLSLNLPVMIDAATRAKLIEASTAEKVAAVYAQVPNTNYWGIMEDAAAANVKALWTDAVTADLIASQIVLEADQIAINGDVIVGENNKIKADKIDVEQIKASAGFFEDITITGTLSNVGGTFVGGLGKKTQITDPWSEAGFNYKPIGDTSLFVIQDLFSQYGTNISILFFGMIQRVDGYDQTLHQNYTRYSFTILQQSDNLTLESNNDGTLNIKVRVPGSPAYHNYYATELSIN